MEIRLCVYFGAEIEEKEQDDETTAMMTMTTKQTESSAISSRLQMERGAHVV